MIDNDKASSFAKNIKLLILDVDGVLTDGGISFDENGVELSNKKWLLSTGYKAQLVVYRK